MTDPLRQQLAASLGPSYTLEWLERGVHSRTAGIGNLYFIAAANPLRKDPRLLVFARRVGLPDQPPY